MPIYEYACGCGYRFERLARIADADGPAPACPACDAADTRRVPSVAALLGQARVPPGREAAPRSWEQTNHGDRDTIRHWQRTLEQRGKLEEKYPELAGDTRAVLAHEGRYAASPLRAGDQAPSAHHHHHPHGHAHPHATPLPAQEPPTASLSVRGLKPVVTGKEVRRVNRLPWARAVADDHRVDEMWMLDELAHAGPEHLDTGFIAGYDRKQGYPDPAADIAAFEAHGLDSTSAIVDFGAGTGQFAIPAARRFGRVTAVDVSPAMLAALRAKAAAAPGGTSLECVRGGFLSYSPAGSVDGVYTRNALHQLPDFWKVTALRRIAGMLRPGGVLRLLDLIYDFAPEETDAVFSDWFAKAATDPAAGYTAADYAEHVRTEYGTFRWLLEPMLAATGFEIADVSYSRRLYGAYTCVRTGNHRI